MKVVVVGCGKIGTAVIGALVREGHDVTAIELDGEVISGITDQYDIMTVQGNGMDYDTLLEAGVPDARLFISVTPVDEFNMLSCLLAKKMGATQTMARMENTSESEKAMNFLKQQTNVSMFLKPAELTASALINMLKLPSGMRAEYFARRNFEMIELTLREESYLSGLSLMEMRKKYKGAYLVCAVIRGEVPVIPDGNFVLQAGDRIMLTAAPNEIDRLLKMLGYMKENSRSVMILGGDQTSQQLAKQLLALGVKVKIIEQDRNRCRSLCEVLPRAVVIHGDGAHGELLKEEGLSQTDAFVALTGIDEENILMSIYASKNNVKRSLCKIDRSEFVSLASSLGCEDYVEPKKLISDTIIRYARAVENSLGSNVETLYRLLDGKLEVLEFIVGSGFAHVGLPLHRLRPKMKDGVLIGGILRGNKTIIPGGDDILEAGDRVIVVANGSSLSDLSDILAEAHA